MYELLENDGHYGIRVGGTCVQDISIDRRAVAALMLRMKQNEMDEQHIFDVIEDWFGAW